MSDNTSANTTGTVIEALGRNVDGLLKNLPLASPHLTLATFVTSTILKFIRAGREIEVLGEAKQAELSKQLRDQYSPTLRTQPDPSLELRRDVGRFFISNGRPNRELKRGNLRPIYDAFEQQITIFAANQQNDPLYQVAVQDLTFVYLYIRPALLRTPPAFADPILQLYFGADIASRDPERLKAILGGIRQMDFEHYSHTPSWYTDNLNGYLHWQLVSYFRERLNDQIVAAIQNQFKAEANKILIDTIFAEGGVFDEAVGTISKFKDEQKGQDLDAVEVQLKGIKREIEEFGAAREEKEKRIDLHLRRLEVDLQEARNAQDSEKVERLEAERRELELTKERLAIEFDEQLLEKTIEKRNLERQKEALQDA